MEFPLSRAALWSEIGNDFLPKIRRTTANREHVQIKGL